VKTIILCGGKGTRAYPHTAEIPKPLLDVAGRPVVRHVMEIYARNGFSSFVLAAGPMLEMMHGFAASLPLEWEVEVVDTGEATNTGERIALCRGMLGDTFFATYCDGLADVDVRGLLEFHRTHPGAATLTSVPLPSQYGTIDRGDDGRVMNFVEKPVLSDHWINAGFFVFDDRAFDHWAGPDLERDVLPELGSAGELYAYRHEGFWKSMDTYKDALELTALATAGGPPWIDHVPAGRPDR
jgi:glucose-1-phosphate cytidylyltransferase